MTTMTSTPPSDQSVGRAAPVARVWLALARREARFTLGHPLIVVGVLASTVLLWSLNRGQLPHLAGYSTYVGIGLAPLAGAALLVAHLATSRAQRNRTVEIEDPAPAERRARTLGHLVGSMVVVPVAVLIVIAYIAYLYWLGGSGQPSIGELLVGPVVVGLGAIAGVSAGTWLPNRFGGLIGLGLLAGVQIALQDAPNTLHWFAWWHTVLWYGGFDLWIRPTWAHLAYLVGTAAVVAAVAAFRHGIRVAPIAITAVGGALILAGGVTQAQLPSEAQVDKRFDQITNPATYWVTVRRSDVTYNLHPSYERWVDWWDRVISDTLAPITPANRPALVIEQWHHPFPSQVIDEFGWDHPKAQGILERANELAFLARHEDPWPIRVGDTLYLPQRTPLAIAAAQRAVGLPLVPVVIEGRPYTEEEIAGFNDEPTDASQYVDWPGRDRGLPRPVLGDRRQLDVSCEAEGQAREVVAAWLAAQASHYLTDLYLDIRLHGPSSTLAGDNAVVEYSPNDAESPTPAIQWDLLGWMQHGGFGGGNGAQALLGSPTATDLTAQLLQRPHAVVAAAINDHWDDWTNPTTGVQVIIDEFDLQAPPTPAEWIERGRLDPANFAGSIAAYPRWVGDEPLGDQSYPICR